MSNIILNTHQVQQKTRRLAYQILEDYHDKKSIILLAIDGSGISYGKQIKKELLELSELKITTGIITIDKRKPLSNSISLSIDSSEIKNQNIILIDDVANTGRTLFYALNTLISIEIKSMKIAVLIDRKHKKFPVSADYVGLTLNTTIKEHIRVTSEKNKIKSVYLD